MKDWFEKVLPYLLIVGSILVVVLVIGLWIIALLKYSGKPITEVPFWAIIFLK